MTTFDYISLLKKAKETLPKNLATKERFEIPKAKGHVEGNKTIISNINQIASSLGREVQHIVKYIQRELATPAELSGSRLILGRKLSSAAINAKLEQYASDFVICRDCKRPDTKLIKESKVLFMKCLACGAKHPIRTKI